MHNTPYATRRNGLPVKPRLKLLRSKESGAYVDPSTREKGAVRTSLTPRERTRASVTISRQGITYRERQLSCNRDLVDVNGGSNDPEVRFAETSRRRL